MHLQRTERTMDLDPRQTAEWLEALDQIVDEAGPDRVNFILDKDFNGFKYQANAGLSAYGDGLSGQVGVAAGTSLFGQRSLKVAINKMRKIVNAHDPALADLKV